jgi:tetratricopeptide (TPR) repeat protein
VATAQGNWDTALQALLRASDAAVDTLDQQAWFEVELGLAELLFQREQFVEAEEHAAMALELSTALADSLEGQASLVESSRIAQAATFLSRIRVARGRLREAREMLSLSLEHPAVGEDPGSSSRLLANLAYACAETGETEGSLSFAQGAFDLARTAGDRMAAARIAINLGAYQLRLGKTADALASFSRAKALARASGWARGVRLAKSAAARIRSGLG